MHEILISIIVPIYKVEKYLDECVQSIIKQYNERIEVILVDDGSPDSCGKMCDEYAQEYDRIKVIHKENGGLSSARNAGLKIATGKYIVFVDSDDMLDDNALNTITKSLDDKILLYSYEFSQIDNQSEFIKRYDARFEEGIINVLKFIQGYYERNNGLAWAAWQSVYRRDIIEKNNITFPEGRNAEDVDFYMQYVMAIKNENMMYSAESIVKYRTNREGSIMTEMKPKTMKNILEVYSKYANVEDTAISEIFSNIYVSGLNYIVKTKNKKLLEEMLPLIDKKIIYRATGGKQKTIASAIKIFGVKNVLGFLQKIS